MSEGRSRRSVSKRVAERHETLTKLAALRGSKHKYELTEEEAVYDEVDEGEYASLVSKRQRDDWIVDDDGTGLYAEHGREIFDDEYEEYEDGEEGAAGGRGGSKSKSNKYRLHSTKRESLEPPKGDIRSIAA
ncbi:DNA polymerase alpha catalytic subunit [Tyrophagus putrescentiae]|nr:DNA polymerase alpha catalytic subunit [Tyrophagus putrescentiae]